MNIYLLTRAQPWDWDTYRSAVVVAPDVDTARLIHPDSDAPKDWHTIFRCAYNWTTPNRVRVRLLGVADSRFKVPGVILNSYVVG